MELPHDQKSSNSLLEDLYLPYHCLHETPGVQIPLAREQLRIFPGLRRKANLGIPLGVRKCS